MGLLTGGKTMFSYVLSIFLLMGVCVSVGAQTSQREHAYDTAFLLFRQGGYSVDYLQGGSRQAEPGYGIGLRVGVNSSARLNLSVQMDYADLALTTVTPSEEKAGSSVVRDRKGQWAGMLKASWHLSSKRFTPYFEAGIGAVLNDNDEKTNLEQNTQRGNQLLWSTGDSERQLSSHAAAELGVGLRYEYNASRFIRASIARRWVDTDFARENLSQYVAQLEIGALVWD